MASLCPEYDPYRVMFAGRGYLAKHAEVVRRFVRANAQGWVDYLTGNPAPANALLRRLRPDLTDDFLAYSIKTMKDNRLVLGDRESQDALRVLRRRLLVAMFCAMVASYRWLLRKRLIGLPRMFSPPWFSSCLSGKTSPCARSETAPGPRT